jgi:hypothetical protein
MIRLIFSDKAKKDLRKLKMAGQNSKLRKIKNTLDKLEENLRHPGLHTHKNDSFRENIDAEVFQSYVENNTPCAYRVFWHYGSEKDIITILSIIPHP